jgi:carbamoyltransferase
MGPAIKNREEWLKSFGEESKKSFSNTLKRVITGTKFYQKIAIKRKLPGRIKLLTQLGFSQSKIQTIEHHSSHAAAVYYGLAKSLDSPYLVLTLDGGGDNVCSTVSVGEKGKIKRIAQTYHGHSLGNIYSRVTYLLGFVPWEHEYKLMGLAPYVSEEKAEKISQIFKRYLTLDPKNPLTFKKLIPENTIQILTRLKRDLFRIRFDLICAGLQKFTEDLIVQWVKECIKETGISKVLCSGGVFMNVKTNQRLLELSEIEELAIMPSCGDETNSIGAAYLTYAEERVKNNQLPNIKPLGPIYFGNEITEKEIEESLKNFPFLSKVRADYYEDIERKIAELLAKGKIVARAKGKMEFGARALGNRSILANPSEMKVIKIINEMIKSRDFWMPFAPSVLKERAEDYYIKPKPIEAPYMIITFDSRPEKREKFLAACHPYDLTTRPQEVNKEWNPDYWKLLKYYEEITGEGIILNTSFNLHGYPIVSNAKDALDVFNRSGLKYLALGNYLISKI